MNASIPFTFSQPKQNQSVRSMLTSPRQNLNMCYWMQHWKIRPWEAFLEKLEAMSSKIFPEALPPESWRLFSLPLWYILVSFYQLLNTNRFETRYTCSHSMFKNSIYVRSCCKIPQSKGTFSDAENWRHLLPQLIKLNRRHCSTTTFYASSVINTQNRGKISPPPISRET